jgi:L-2-hydroxyglutarate oxidase LhgO
MMTLPFIFSPCNLLARRRYELISFLLQIARAKNTLKATLCVQGNRMLYDLCAKYHIPFKKFRKLTVAVTESEIDELEMLMRALKQTLAFRS